jgi:hypothetical protein
VSISTPLFSPGVGRVVVSPIDDSVNPLSTVLLTQWAIQDRIATATRTFAWKITAQGISTQKAFTFNARKRMHVYPQYIKYGMDHPIVWPIDQSPLIPGITWDIDTRFFTTKKFSWRVISRISSKKRSLFNVRIIRHTNKSFGWDTLFKVTKPGFVNPNWRNRIMVPVTHPIDSPNHKVNSYIQYNSEKRISKSQAMRFNYRISASADMTSYFSIIPTRVACRKVIEWETLMRL